MISHFIASLGLFLCASGEALSPHESIATMETAPGVRVELVASEPDVVDPVAVAFDEAGRMYVVEDIGYPEDDSGRGRVALLTDDDGDGRYERRATFCDGLQFPNGVMPWKGGVFVTDAPYLLYFKDTDGDGRADVREVVLEGFSLGGSTQLRVSHPTLGLDNWVHLANGLSGGDVRVSMVSSSETVSMGQLDLRFDPIGNRLERAGGRAQFGLTFDAFGHKFVCSNRNHIQQVLFAPEDLTRNPLLTRASTYGDIPDHGAAARVYAISSARTTAYAHAGTFTAACGLVVYGGTALPEQFRGNAFVCEPTGNLVHRDMLERDGMAFVAKRARDKTEFLRSFDEWFRPVFLANGPGGALYLCDMYRATIEHPTYLPPDVAEVTDFQAGKDRGRIYRIVGTQENSDIQESVDVLAQPVSALASKDIWTRRTAHRLLLERQDADVEEGLRSLVQDGRLPETRVHALSLYFGLGIPSGDVLMSALADHDPRVREFALGLARGLVSQSDALRKRVLALGEDNAPAVRYAAAMVLGDWDDERAAKALARIASSAPLDEWSRTAVLSGVKNHLDTFTGTYLDTAKAIDASTMRSLGRMIAKASSRPDTGALLSAALVRGADASDEWKRAFVLGALSGGSFNTEESASALAALRPVLLVDASARLDALIEVARKERNHSESAVELLGYGNYQSHGSDLIALLDVSTPVDVQQEAVRALFRMDVDRAAEAVLEENTWDGLTGAIRNTALTHVLRVPGGPERLLDAVGRGAVPDWAVTDRYRQRLRNHRDDSIKARARELFPETRQEDRMAAYENLKPVLELPPDPAAGKAVFEERCAQCHTFGSLGHEVGPDLTGIGSQPLESILLHIVVPNWLKLPGYENYLVSTKDFMDYSGIMVSESDSTITLRAPFGVESVIERENIDSIRMTGLSLMPENLEEGMKNQELRNLIGFLKRGVLDSTSGASK